MIATYSQEQTRTPSPSSSASSINSGYPTIPMSRGGVSSQSKYSDDNSSTSGTLSNATHQAQASIVEESTGSKHGANIRANHVSNTQVEVYSQRSRQKNQLEATLVNPFDPAYDTPIRTKSARELISHFETQSSPRPHKPTPSPSTTARNKTPGSCPRAANRMVSTCTPPYSLLPTTPRQAPLPAKPIISFSASKSPIRSFMNMVGLTKKKPASPTPIPRKRLLLYDDTYSSKTGSPIAPHQKRLNVDASSSNAGVMPSQASAQQIGMPSSSKSHGILRAGPLLYASSSLPHTKAPVWNNSQAVLQSPNLDITLAASPFSKKTFNLQHATVESLPSVMLDSETLTRLGMDDSGDSTSGGTLIFVFELSVTENQGDTKERFAAISPWERGKWVCHIWDAICSANDVQIQSDSPSRLEETSTSPASITWPDPQRRSESPEHTHRLEPPLRVVNVSKLSAFFDGDPPNVPKSPLKRTSTGMPNASPPLYSHPIMKTQSTPQRTMVFPSRYADASPRNAKGRNVPSSPSIHNLGRKTIVQEQLAKLELRNGEGSSFPNVGGLSTPPTSPQKAVFAITPLKKATNAPPPEIPSSSPLTSKVTKRRDKSGSDGNDPQRIKPVDSALGGSITRPQSNSLQHAPFPILRNLPSLPNGMFSASRALIEEGEEEETYHAKQLPAPPATSDLVPLTAALPILSSSRPQPQATPPVDNLIGDNLLPGVSAIPDPYQAALSPLFTLVQEAAMTARSVNDGLVGRLEAIREELEELKMRDANLSTRDVTSSTSKTPNIDHVLVRSSNSATTTEEDGSSNTSSHAEIKNEVEAIKEKVDAVLTTLGSFNDTNQTNKSELESKLDSNHVSLTDQLESKHAELSSKVNEVKDLIAALSLEPLVQKLDAISAATTKPMNSIAAPPLPPEPSRLSVFKNQGKALPSMSTPTTIDITPILNKLDIILSKDTQPSSIQAVDLGDINERLNSLSTVCKEVLEKVEATQANELNSVSTPGVVEDGEGSEKMDLGKLLSCLQDDQTHRERYYTDLNNWLQTGAAQTGAQYHSIATQLQTLTQALSATAELQPSPSSDLQDPSAAPSSVPQHTSILQDIRQALIESNQRSRVNDSFMATAHQLIGIANTERQSLAILFGSQREELEKLLAGFAVGVVNEIRGEKHRFVDAMEKATALNVEGQLGELKAQISDQFFSMTEEVDRLREERKGLEHQIAELLTFKNRFAQMPSATPQRQNSSLSQMHPPNAVATEQQAINYPRRAQQPLYNPNGNPQPRPLPPTSRSVRRPLPIPTPPPLKHA